MLIETIIRIETTENALLVVVLANIKQSHKKV